MHRFRTSLGALALVAGLLFSQATAFAQTSAGTGTVTGTVTDTQGHTLSGAAVSLTGPAALSTVTDARGAFQFSNVPQGLYSLSVAHAGFVRGVRDDVTVIVGQPTNVVVALQPTSFSSLQEIAHVSVTSVGSINTSSAAMNIVPVSTFEDQGQVQVGKILNETPGIVATFGGGAQNGEINGAAMGSFFVPQIRGSLPYETQTLIDGHPVSIGFLGGYTSEFIDPNILQQVEVVKGPGAFPDNINYAVNGSVNYLTLEPTLKPRQSVGFTYDAYGGLSSNYRATGSLGNGRLGYALDYSLNGSPGPLNPYRATLQTLPTFATGNPFSSPTINGVQPCPLANCGSTVTPVPGNVFSNQTITTPAIAAGIPISTDYFNKSELAKIRWRPSQYTSLTATWIGTQSHYNDTGAQLYTDSNVVFAPPAGYTGLIPAGPISCCGQVVPQFANVLQSILEGEFRTVFGHGTSLLARYYSGFIQTYLNTPTQSASNPSYNNVTLYGGLPMGGSATPTIWNGTPGIIAEPESSSSVYVLDQLGGATLELDQTAGQNLYSLAYDAQGEKSLATVSFWLPSFTAPLTAPSTYTTFNFVTPGSKQTYNTITARALLQLAPKLSLNLADYQLSYTSHFSTDGGVTFNTSTHGYNAPRLAVTYRSDPDTSWRFAAGSSISPPYIRQISSGSFPPEPNNFAAPTYYLETLNSGNLAPETAFGYDVGVDFRLGRGAMQSAGSQVLASLDGYVTNLKNQFYTTTTLVNPAFLNPTFPTNPALPLYATQTVNVADARYAGIEATARVRPPLGLGWTAQGALIRAYVYDLPPGFYNTPAGPNTTNLGVIPYVNFQGSAYTGEQNGIWTGSGLARVPYAQGYGELNYRWSNGIYANLGATYYGSNNSYNSPAFITFSANLRLQLSKYAQLLLSGDNLTAQHSSLLPCLDCGTPVPLINGQVAKSVGVNLGPPTFRANVKFDLDR